MAGCSIKSLSMRGLLLLILILYVAFELSSSSTRLTSFIDYGVALAKSSCTGKACRQQPVGRSGSNASVPDRTLEEDMQGEQHEQKSQRQEPVVFSNLTADASAPWRKLVLFCALGVTSAIGTVTFNVQSHFSDWDCIVFVHADEQTLSSDHPQMKEIAESCSIVRMPGFMWTHFLMTVTPELVRPYEHIAVVLDDVFAPIHGETRVSVPELLDNMKQHNLASISPAIQGSFWSSCQPQEQKCLWKVNHIETFFQIMTQELFVCWRSHMEYTNPQGNCLDLCLQDKLCPAIAESKLFVDTSMVVYHLGTGVRPKKAIPKSAVRHAKLAPLMARPKPRGKATETFHVCERHECATTQDTFRKPEILSCQQQQAGGSSNDTLTSVASSNQTSVASSTRSTTMRRSKRYLVTFLEIKDSSMIDDVFHNVQTHFLEKYWDCVIFIHTNETTISMNEQDSRLQELSQRCTIVQRPGIPGWAHFLMTLTPELMRQYQNIAIIRGAVSTKPQEAGEKAVNVPSLLETMNRLNLSSISPAVRGAAHMKGLDSHNDKGCGIYKVDYVETYFQNMTSSLFDCWRSFLDYTNPHGACLDICLQQDLCPAVADGRLAVDADMMVHHPVEADEASFGGYSSCEPLRCSKKLTGRDVYKLTECISKKST